MPKIIILPLGLYIDNNVQRTMDAFVGLGVNPLALAFHLNIVPLLPTRIANFFAPTLPDTIREYRLGNLSTEIFRAHVRAKFPRAKSLLNDEAFDKAWNAMQKITPALHNVLAEVRELQKNNCTTYFVCGTNPLHIQDILRQLNPEMTALLRTSYFSYELHILELDLVKKLANDVSHFSSDVVMFYSPPKPRVLEPIKFTWRAPLDCIKKYLNNRWKKIHFQMHKDMCKTS